jgi:hypothetical protein
MGLAIHGHHDNLKAFPSGGMGPSTIGGRTFSGASPANYATQGWGWCYQILPYIEQSALWSLPAGNAQDATIIAAPMPFLYCPTRGRATVVSGTAVSDYSGNGGSYGTWNSLSAPSNSLDGVFVPSPTSAGGSKVTMLSITDGTSNTLLVGEKWIYTQWYNDRTSGGGSCIDNEGWANGWDNDSIGMSGTISYTTANLYSGSQYVVLPVPDTTLAWSCGMNFGSAHTSSFGCVLCDGTARFVSYSVNPTVWHNFCARNDNQAIDLNSL